MFDKPYRRGSSLFGTAFFMLFRTFAAEKENGMKRIGIYIIGMTLAVLLASCMGESGYWETYGAPIAAWWISASTGGIWIIRNSRNGQKRRKSTTRQSCPTRPYRAGSCLPCPIRQRSVATRLSRRSTPNRVSTWTVISSSSRSITVTISRRLIPIRSPIIRRRNLL